MAVLFTDTFDGSGSWNGRSADGRTWTASGGSTISGGNLTISAGSGQVSFGTELVGLESLYVEIVYTLPEFAGLTITLASSPGSADPDIGNGWRVDYQGQYSGDTYMSVNGDTSNEGDITLHGSRTVRIEFSDSSNTVYVKEGGVTLCSSSTVDPAVNLTGVYLNITGAYDPVIHSISVGEAEPPTFWTDFVSSREEP